MYEVKFHIFDEELQKLWDNGQVFLTHQVSHFESILQYISYHWCTNGTHVSDTIDSFMSTILFFLASADVEMYRSAYIDIADYSLLTKRTIHYLESNYMEPYRLEHLADALNYNKNYICTVFRQDTGITVVDYLTYIRIRRFLGWIYYSDDVKINTLGQRAGYRNPSHFNRVFKKMTGMTPRKCARDLIGNDHASGLSALAQYYEDYIGLRILPLQDALEHMKKMGEVTE